MKLSSRIFGGIILTTLISVVFTTVIVAGLLYNNLSNETKTQIKNEAEYISEIQNISPVTMDISRLGNRGQNRITLIGSDGTVKYDNYSDFNDMENHIGRPEVQDALEKGSGESTRTSDTFGKKTYYYAVRLSSGDILRVACETSSMFGVIFKAMPGILFSIIILLAIAMSVAGFLTKTIVNPINELDIDNPTAAKAYDELSPLLVKIDTQNKEMIEQISTIYDTQRENEFITQHMNDGLIIISSGRHIISANMAAKKIFDFDNVSSNNGKINYLSICRDKKYMEAVEKAFHGISGDITLERGERIYRISISSVAKDFSAGNGSNKIYAVLMFIHDVTEKEASEQMRREFSANVSHELKTPLTSIMGCSEIMKAGIAKPEDMPRFLGQINSEAKRLLALIDDIIRLSSLDEGNDIEMSDVDLYKVSGDVLNELEMKAKQSEITLELEGSSQSIEGNERLIHEVIFNLCDNSIRYNKEGGKVKITVGKSGDKKFISVEDNGIGIPKEEQDRVFERFYRVDKSHSKETGGTGLGLSIVKHTVLIHHGKITMNSEVSKGTKITVTF